MIFQHMACTARAQAKTILKHGSVAAFLCPALLRPPLCTPYARKSQAHIQTRQIQVEAGIIGPIEQPHNAPTLISLPSQCPGCGAYTQSSHPENAGYYSVSRKSVKSYINQRRNLSDAGRTIEDAAFDQVTTEAKPELLKKLGLTETSSLLPAHEELAIPVCNRCHNLLHHRTGVPVVHPSIESIQDIISESPYKHNHIYHVLDAADFPLSLIPRLQHYLSLSPQRSYNRRSAKSKYRHGRKAEISFIVTRSDLLAPQKEQVDSLMPYITGVLRDALGSAGKDVRLGNVRCVSSKRGWWTRDVKEDVWERGGGGWMVGKANVGKSNLFECIFPKGRTQEVNFRSLRGTLSQGTSTSDAAMETQEVNAVGAEKESPLLARLPSWGEEEGLEYSFLPPAPREEQYPVMPVVSSLPGTTASPIRLLFGGGKGELIDLPGLVRENLEGYVSDEHRQDLFMRQRIKPEKFSIKTGQSLLLGGIIRITPTTPNIVLLAYPFVPLSGHVTSTEKAIAIQTQEHGPGVPSIAKPGTGKLISSAGTYQVSFDVTKQRAGPLTAPAAVGLKAQWLPFLVYSVDILVEGCGWVELVVQVRRKDVETRLQDGDGAETEIEYPEVEVFSPQGRHIGSRRPMNAWLLGGDKPTSIRQQVARPRRSMKGVKKNSKKIMRMQKSI